MLCWEGPGTSAQGGPGALCVPSRPWLPWPVSVPTQLIQTLSLKFASWGAHCRQVPRRACDSSGPSSIPLREDQG